MLPNNRAAFCNVAPLLGNRNLRNPGVSVQQRSSVQYSTKVARRPISSATGWAAARTKPLPNFKRPVETGNYIPGAPIEEPIPLSINDLLAIVRSEAPDLWPNEIVRSLLGWRQNEDGFWDSTHVPDEWRKPFPDSPPDFIGDPTDYSRERDMPVKLAVAKLTRSILPEHKNGFPEVMKPAGFPGLKVKDLTPNRTRRAVCVNYIIFWYRMHFPDYVWK